MTKIIDGQALAKKYLTELKTAFSRLPAKPLLVDVLVGADPVSLSYVKIKGRTAAKVGVDFEMMTLPESCITAQVVEKIATLARHRSGVSGVIVQLPLPVHISREEVVNAIDPQLDIDCIGQENTKNFYAGRARFVPPAAAAVMLMLESLKMDLKKKSIIVVGQGLLVGKPLTFMLEQMGLPVFSANRDTNDLPGVLKRFDIVVSATGQARLISGGMLKPGAIVIDAGTSESAGAIVGDVETSSVNGVAGWLSPVPGGVGPLTVAMLYKNLLAACGAPLERRVIL